MSTRYITIICNLFLICFIACPTSSRAQIFDSRFDFEVGDQPQSIAVDDLDGDGNADMVSANNESYNVSVILANGKGGFHDAVNYWAGTGPRAVAIGDFNEDTIPDLAVVNHDSEDVSVLLGNGNGTFSHHVNCTTGIAPVALALGDLNGDGNLDMAVANSGSDDVSFFHGNGTGSFLTVFTYSVGSGPCSIDIGDLDGNHSLDIAVANRYSDNVSILLSNIYGSFDPAINFNAGIEPVSIVVAELNDDGNNDLAVANVGTSYEYATILFGDGDGNFPMYYFFSSIIGLSAITAGDLNGDGFQDLTMVDSDTCSASVVLGNGTGTFKEGVSYGGIGSPTSIAVADINGDGLNDLATANSSDDSVSMMLGNGDGTLQAGRCYKVGGSPTDIAIGDFDSDLRLDLFTISSTDIAASVLLGNGDGTFRTTFNCYLGNPQYNLTCPGARLVKLGDLNGDNIPDPVIAGYDDFGNFEYPVVTLLGNGDGTFIFRNIHDEGYYFRSMEFGDLDGDGNQDLAIGSYDVGWLNFLFGDGDGGFRTSNLFFGYDLPYQIAIGDMNGDGLHDLVMTHYDYVYGFSILLSNGDGTFEIRLVKGDLLRSAITMCDLDGDNDLDLAIAGSDVAVYLNNGDATFQKPMYYWVGDISKRITFGDIDGDSHVDLVLSDDGVSSFSVLTGNGDGTFQSVWQFNTGNPAQNPSEPQLNLGDLDNDGDSDIVTVNSDCGTISVFNNNSRSPTTISADISCTPSSGKLPFSSQFTVTVNNLYDGYFRRMATHIDFALANGSNILDWKSGVITIDPLDSSTSIWMQSFPDVASLTGLNSFTLFAEDVTPSPYNQPPYPPAGDSDTSICEVTGH